MASSQQRYSLLVAALTTRAGVRATTTRKRRVGTTALSVDNRLFAMLSSNEELVVRLPTGRVAALVAAGQGDHFQLSHGQPLQQWFVAGVALENSWLPLAEEALSFVADEIHRASNT